MGDHPPPSLTTLPPPEPWPWWDKVCLLFCGCRCRDFNVTEPVEFGPDLTPEVAQMHRSHLQVLEQARWTCWVGMSALLFATIVLAFWREWPFAQIPGLLIGFGSTLRVTRALNQKRVVVAALPQEPTGACPSA